MGKTVEDHWPKAWKRPLYGPDVVARRLVAAGRALLEGSEPMASKTVKDNPVLTTITIYAKGGIEAVQADGTPWKLRAWRIDLQTDEIKFRLESDEKLKPIRIGR